MKIFEVPTPIFKQEIKEHYSIKKSLLNYFNFSIIIHQRFQ